MTRARTKGIPKDENGKLVFTDPLHSKLKLREDVPRSYPLATNITCRCGKTKSVDIHKKDFHCKKCGMFVPAIGNVPRTQGKLIKRKYGASWER